VPPPAEICRSSIIFFASSSCGSASSSQKSCRLPVGGWALNVDRSPSLDEVRSPERSNVMTVLGGFLGGWLLGIIVTGILADVMKRAMTDRYHDGGMYFLAAFAIVIELPALAVLRAMFPRYVNGLTSFIFGLACGPLLLAVLLVIGLVLTAGR
jgi:hypothetical protein